MLDRPHRLVIVGTGTEIGKTWVAVQLLERARALGLKVAVRKPAQSYPKGDNFTDADLLSAASGEAPEQVCPLHRWYPIPMAPPMAADALGRAAIKLEELLVETSWPSNVDFALVETAGGLRSPISHDADNLDLLEGLNPTQVILVADAGLGTINTVRLCLQALKSRPTIVFLNRYDGANDLHVRNRAWLAKEGVKIETEVAQLVAKL